MSRVQAADAVLEKALLPANNGGRRCFQPIPNTGKWNALAKQKNQIGAEHVACWQRPGL